MNPAVVTFDLSFTLKDGLCRSLFPVNDRAQPERVFRHFVHCVSGNAFTLS
jgi:hypothetical protein